MPSAAPQKSAFSPGETAPATGIYEVQHERHRAPHLVIVLRGEQFPPCRDCGENARFLLQHATDHMSVDADLIDDPDANSRRTKRAR